MRKGYTQFTKKDFEDFPIWELQHSLTTAEPYQGEIPFKEDRFRAFFVRTKFTLADKTKLMGWTMVCIPPYEVHGLSPTILTDEGRIDLTKVAAHPKQKDVDGAFRKLGKTVEKVFPLKFETDVPVPSGPAKGEMKGFLYRLKYEDDKGWRQHLDIYYQTASELDAAIQVFNEKEAARKAALEPSKQEKAFLKAAKLGDVAKLRSFLSKGVNFNRGGTFDYGGYTRKNVTALMLAAEHGHSECLRILLESGADIDLADDTNEPRDSAKTALLYACRAKQTEIARLLLKAGANPNHQLSYGHTVFDDVCYEGELPLVRLLLDFGANPNASCGKDYFALKRAVAAGNLEVVKLLLNSGADVNGADDDDETVLIYASKLLRWEIFQLLLASGADVGRKTLGRRTALHAVVITATDQNPQFGDRAVENFRVAMQIIKALIQHGANVNAVTKYGDTPLSLAKNASFPELIEYLVSKEAK